MEGRIRYKYLQFGLTTTFVTVPVHDMAFAPGFSTGNSPFIGNAFIEGLHRTASRSIAASAIAGRFGYRTGTGCQH